MTDVCNATVYAMNPFHLLGLSPFSNSREIRRRKEDFESAAAMGESGWKDEFGHLLGNTQVPSREMVGAAFRRIEDPQQRIVDEFFWFWPIGKGDDEALVALLREDRMFDAERAWKKTAKSSDISRAVMAKHNLAVYNHFYAIDAEWHFIENDVGAADAPDEHTRMCRYWKAALAYWEDLADDDDFWELVKERVAIINDKRLRTGFIRRMRDEFPIAFDRINGDLAVEYAKLSGKHAETERHLRYMKASHQGLDDVGATLDALFDPIEREVDLLTREAIRVRNATPHSALSAAQTLLQNTEGIRKIADEMLGKDHPKRRKLFDKIAAECNFCLVAYGNKTEQWEECLKFIKGVIRLASDEELVGKLNNNLRLVTRKAEDYRREHYCWFCKKHPADPKFAVEIKLYGDVRIQTQMFSSQYRAVWRNITVSVPRCGCCEEAKRKRDAEEKDAWHAYQEARARRGFWDSLFDFETDESRAAKCVYDKIHEANGRLARQEEALRDQFPLLAELKKKNFKNGERPTDQECQQLYQAQLAKEADWLLGR